MNFCEGQCGEQHENYNRDKLILQDKKFHPDSPFTKRLSCCIPIKWSSIEVIINNC